MEREILLDQIDFVQARIEEIDKKVINWKPEDKGYKELVDSYNKWIDRYNDLLDKLEHINDIDIDVEKLKLEREKFIHDIEEQKRKEPIELIFRSADLGVKILAPILAITGTVAVAKLAYLNDTDLKLCNGRIFGQTRDLIKLATMKV